MSPSLFDQLTRGAQLGMCAVDAEFHYIWVNDALCDLLGYDADELIGRSFMSITHEADAPLDEHLSQRVFDGEIPFFNVRKRYIKKDGSTVVADLVAVGVRDETGTTTTGFGTLIPVD
ncbi:MAG: PAS domain S-box protein [Actinomycetota bacterium]